MSFEVAPSAYRLTHKVPIFQPFASLPRLSVAQKWLFENAQLLSKTFLRLSIIIIYKYL